MSSSATEFWKARIEEANLYRAGKLRDNEIEVSRLREHLNQMQLEADKWKSMIPAAIIAVMDQEASTAAETQAKETEKRALIAGRLASLDAAYLERRGILPPEVASTKRTIFSATVGVALGGIALLTYVLLLGLAHEWIGIALAIAGFALGSCIGLWLFQLNYVIDRTLEFSPRWQRLQVIPVPRPYLRCNEARPSGNWVQLPF